METGEIGKRMKQRREEKGISALEIAEATGLTKATIHRYESGEIKNIKLPVIETIAKTLEVNPSWLIGKSDDKKMRYAKSYVEETDRHDLKKVLNGLVEYIHNREDLVYGGHPLTEEIRLSLIGNIEAIKKITDKLFENQ